MATGGRKGQTTKPKIKLPPGYENESAFLTEMRTLFEDDVSADQLNREAGLEDLAFLVGDQWDPAVKAERIGKRKPVLTINRLPAFVGQVLGERLENETEIKIVPDTGGTKQVAKVREGIVRSIQRCSMAEIAYETAFLGQVAGGIGNWKIVLDYVSDDVWEQEIRIAQIPDSYAVVWDRSITDPTGRDAKHAFEVEVMPWRDFCEKWPWATPADMMASRMQFESTSATWWTKDDVRIVAYWHMRTEKRTLALMLDNTTQDITDVDDPAILANIASREDGTPFIREVDKPYAERYLCTATDILEGPYKLPLYRVPLFRVPGWELRIGETRHRWGIIRHMKDPQRLHNYWRSAIAEKIMRSPKNTWIAADAAVAGREQAWRDSAYSDDSLLVYNSESGQKPERQPPIQVEGALIEQSAVTAQDMKDVSNIHEANLGMPSNEVSGRAIIQRRNVSRTGTAIYMKRLEQAIEETGNAINELIPIVYDTPRIIRILGEDDAKPLMQAINQVADGEFLDITQGKYSVTTVTGPTYATRRAETTEAMLGLATAMPNVLGTSADILVEAMDWPEAERVAARIKRSLPPTLFGPEELDEDMVQRLQGEAAAAASAASMEQAGAAAKIMKTQADAGLSAARSQKYLADAGAVPVRTQIDKVTAASQVASRQLNDSLKAIEVGTEAN